MVTTATLCRFQVELADIDQGLYTSLNLRVAQHPSEDDERLVVRVLARALAHEEGLEFGRGLQVPDEAGLWSHTLTGELGTWIDVGLPSADRLHRASKAAERLVVFTHKNETALRKEWSARRIHKAESIQVVQLPLELVQTLAGQLSRKESWHVTVQDGELSVTSGELVVEGQIQQQSLIQILRPQA